MSNSMDEFRPSNPTTKLTINDYLPSAGLVGLIFAVVIFALGIILGYQTINSEPNILSFLTIFFGSPVICLLGSVCGFVAVWHFSKEVTNEFNLAQGAIIGFIAGAIVAIVSLLLTSAWNWIDPEYTLKFQDAMMRNIDMLDIPDEQKDQIENDLVENDNPGIGQLFFYIPIYGVLSTITALIGTKMFAQKADEQTF